MDAQKLPTLPTGEEDNVNPSSRKRIWFITVNKPKLPTNPDLNNENVIQYQCDMLTYEELENAIKTGSLLSKGDRMISQIEVGKKCGRRHFHVHIRFKNNKTFSAVKRIFPIGQIKYLKDKKKDIDDNVRYCSKDETRVEGPFNFGIKIPPPRAKLKIITELRPWQKKIEEEILEDPDDRKIHWICDYDGNKGKTQLAKYLCHVHGALFVGGKGNDIKYAVAQQAEKDQYPRIIILGLPRTIEDYVSYSAIEEVKDGIFFSGKYESGMVIGNSPHVLCFANFYPDTAKMTKDRWKITCL